MKILTKHTISVLALLLPLVSCVDDEFFRNGDIPEGETELAATVGFHAFVPALETRAAGDAIKEINTLWLAIYEQKEGADEWTLEEGGKIRITAEDHRLKTELADNKRPDGEDQAETGTGHASFRFRHKNGQYKIYAVANYDLSGISDTDIDTPDKLKNLNLTWDETDVRKNAEMFGCFTNDEANAGTADGTVIVSPNRTLHAWICRAASKVTVAFDGSSLKEGVSIYLKALRIKKIPRTCKLGADNTIDNEDDLIATGEEVTYSESTSYDAGYPALVTKEQPYYPGVRKANEDGTLSWVMDPDAHSETNPKSLFFYENMQGTGPDKKQHDDKNNDGVLDELYKYTDKPYATYIEVDTYYESTNPERLGRSNITYRFMLGQDIDFDYNARRNCHYKLTLHFNGFANDPDWRIDYVTRLGVTQPKTVDYRGKYFVPDNVSANQGNNFMDDNAITVTSFMYQNDDWYTKIPVDFKIEYREAGSTEFTEIRPEWLGEFTKTDKKDGVYELKINYLCPYTSQNINETLTENPSKNGPYDLSTKGDTESMNTANCYIVDAAGTYRFPLVYGNAITDGGTNTASYTCNTWFDPNTDVCLKNFVNYKNLDINGPYILEDIYGSTVPSDVKAELVWQDAPNLVTGIIYDATAYGGKGGITFSTDNIQEGNAVIALKDPEGVVMWSWHIWVTAFDLSRTHKLTVNPNAGKGNTMFEILPVNLGWCSGGEKIRYYERHECEVRITQIISNEGQEGMSQTVKIVQEPHIALPCGDNPYFQWGRKDPFIAAGDANETTKTWYDANGASLTNAPSLMYADGESRVPTHEATYLLIQNPDKWQNGPRVVNDDPKIPGYFRPADNEKRYHNLWDNSWPDDNGTGANYVVKTIYDPCPAGYHVTPLYAFTGFTDTSGPISQASGDISIYMYAATEDNMMPNTWDNYKVYRDNIEEFYIDKTKLISIGFPANGYRDWDDNAKVHQYGQGEIWHAQAPLVSWPGNKPYTAYHLEFTRLTELDPHIYPWNNFYATDGFPVRPTRTLP